MLTSAPSQDAVFDALQLKQDIATAANGIIKTSNVFSLGGSLTVGTTILGGNNSFNFGQSGGELFQFRVVANDTIDISTPSVISLNGGGAGSIITVGTNTAQIKHASYGDLVFGSAGNFFTDIHGTKKGIEYNADYSANYSTRSLVDKAYVDTVAALKANLASPTFTGTPSLPTGTTGITQSANNNSTALATTAYADAIAALKANLSSPTFTGTPTLPTGTIATTQTAGNSSTAIATTAFVATSFAPLASPTFTGTPSLPTGTTAVTQSAADSTTKLATTAFVTTADNLKANLASPTFTGTPALPTGTTGVTQAASDNSTKISTTAYVDTGLALKANLASPSFTGTPSLPTGTTAITQTAGNSTTAIATTAFVTTADNLKANLASPTFTGTVGAAAVTLTGLLTTVASATGTAGVNIPHGVAPTTPVNGDIWTSSTSGLFTRINSANERVMTTGLRELTATSATTVQPTGDIDIITITAQSTGITFNDLSGGVSNISTGWSYLVRLKDNGTSRAITWGGSYRGIAAALPSSTTLGKVMYMEFMANFTEGKWDMVRLIIQP